MVSNSQKRMEIRRKFHIPPPPPQTKSVKMRSVIDDMIFYIYTLELKLQAIKREVDSLTKTKQLVKVEDFIRGGFRVRVASENSKELLICILQIFEERSLEVLHARVSRNDHCFAMEAYVKSQDQAATTTNTNDLTQAIMEAIKSANEKAMIGMHK